jgi:hypothetical protein
MGQYGKAALLAKRLIIEASYTPISAWKSAIASQTQSPSSRDKSCPRGAFLGLCAAGLIKGIASHQTPISTARNLNAQYAISAWKQLQNNSKLSMNINALWGIIGNARKTKNEQMDVVLSLWHDEKWN